MIVYPAYVFMKKAKKLFTHLFENGKSNYPTDFAANVVLNEAGLIIPGNGVKAAFLEIPMSKFRTLNFPDTERNTVRLEFKLLYKAKRRNSGIDNAIFTQLSQSGRQHIFVSNTKQCQN